MIAHIPRDDRQPVHACGPFARDRGLSRVAPLGDLGGRIGGRGRRDRGRPGHRREQAAALVEGGRMGADDADLVERNVLRPDQAVADRQDGLARDRERRLIEEVVRLVDRAGQRALDREDAEGDLSVCRRRHHRREARQRDELGAGRKQVVAGRGAVRAVTAWIGDVHSHG